MGVKYLLDLLQSNTIPDGVVEVDLFRVAKESLSSSSSAAAAIATATATATAGVGSSSSSSSKSKFCLVVDGECCLNRLYGGFYSDWICGGQWNRMADFLDKLVSSAQKADIELTVFFNGAIEPQRMNEWIVQQKQEYGKIQKIFFHVSKFGVAPSNKLWIAPVGLRMALRMMLRHKNVNVVSTIDDYRQEVIAYCRENNIHGLVTDDAEYMAFDPPRLFSASKLKLRFKGTLESQEFVVSALLKELQLSNEKLCVLMALLGNYLLSDKDLGDVYKAANIESAAEENTAESVIRKLARYLNELNVCTNDLDETAIRILGAADDDHVRRSALKQSIQYYLDGTKDGFFKYRSVCSSVCASAAAAAAADADTIATTTAAGDVGASIGSVSERGDNYDNEDVQITVRSLLSYEPDLDTSKLASENVSCEKNLLNAYKEAQSCFTNAAGPHDEQLSVVSAATANGSSTVNGFADIIADVITPLTNERTTSTTRTMDSIGEEREMEMRKEENRKPVGDILPSVPHEVMRTVSERHSKGLMSPYIYQILSQGEIKLPVIVEDIKQNLSIYSFFKPIRQMVYAIVFNLHHRTYMACKNNAAVPTSIRIKEWIFNPVVQTHQAEYVEAEAVGWRVPTIQRLWFGTTQDDKRRRLRAFLTCMRSDVQLLLNPEFVPQQLLVAAVVLRYMMSFADKKVLRKPELDAFIVAALAPEFNVPNFIQELKIPQLSCRGVHLAAMFMKGVEMAMLVNDACGAPIPWLMCCPWLFFDGKLFHHMFVKAISVKNLHELCDNRVGLVMRAERMRQAILEGLNVQFARPPLSAAAAAAATTTTLSPRSHIASSPPPPPQQLPPTPEELKSTSYANSLHRSPFTNYHHQRRHHHHHQQQQHQPHPNHDHHHDNQRNRRRHHQHHHPHHYYHHHHHLQHQHQHQHRHYHRTRMPVASCASNGGNNLARSLTCTTGVGLARPTRSLGGRLEIAGVVVGSWGANYNLSRSTPYDSAAAATYLVPPPPPQLPLPSSRQIGPAVRNNYHQHQFTAGYRAAPTAALLSPSQRSAFVSARSASRNIKPSFVKKKLCNEERTMVKGKGRGLVIDTTSCTAKSFSLSSAASSSSSFCGDTATATATTTTSTATAAVVVTFTPTPIATDAASSTMATVLATSISADDADCDAEMTKAKINEKTTNAADGDTMLLIGQGDSGVSDVKSIHEASKSLVEAISE